jgi:hypothetical protein
MVYKQAWIIKNYTFEMYQASSPAASLAEQGSLPLPHPKWHVPWRWGGGRSSAAASVAWSVLGEWIAFSV